MIRCAILFLLAASALGRTIPEELELKYGRWEDWQLQGKVINGNPADPGEYPSQVTLLYGGIHNCGGTIISERWVLTAAHCVRLPFPNLISVRVGTNRWNEGTDHDILTIIDHPGFNFTDFTTEDIGLIEVSTPFVFNNVTQPASLPEQEQETPGGSPGIIVGWGLTENNTIPFNLQEADVTIRSYDECYSIYEAEIPLTTAQMCADVPEGGVGVCSGDSGGPLYSGGQIVGIASWTANGCAAQGWPAVFTRVAAYRDWIREQSGV